MDKKKRAQLAARNWAPVSVQDFLGLTPDEIAYIDLKLHLAREIKRVRGERQYTQKELAAALGSSQSRVSKMEHGDPSVSLDFVIRALFYLGVNKVEIAKMIDSFEPSNYEGPKTIDIVNADTERDRSDRLLAELLEARRAGLVDT